MIAIEKGMGVMTKWTNPFIPYPYSFIYSQDYINSDDKMAKVKRVCEQCGKEFYAVKSRIEKGWAKYCSIECYGYAQRKRTLRTCEICGRKFEAFPSDIKRGKARFCSNLCKRVYYSGLYRKREKRICKWCDGEFEEVPARIMDGKGFFCSKDCYTEWQKNDKGTLKRLEEIRVGIKKPTKPERIFEDICKRNDLPFHYVGNRDFWIGKKEGKRLNPDFIETNGKKVLVEVMGQFWHSPLLNRKLRKGAGLEYRKKYFKHFKWHPIFIWETDLLRKDAEVFVLYELKKEGVKW